MKKIKAIEKNYQKLFDEYIKYKDLKVIKQGKTCEDIFEDKILAYIEYLTITNQIHHIQPEQDTVNEFKLYVKPEQKERKINAKNEYIDGLLYDNYSEDYEAEQKEKLKYLFIDYQPINNKK